MTDLTTLLRSFGEMPFEDADIDPLIGAMNGLSHRAAGEIERLRAALMEIARITAETHEGQPRAYTALSLIDGIARRGLG